MMNQGPTNRYHLPTVSIGSACWLAIGLLAVAGCGSSEPAESTVVTPPAPAQDSTAETESTPTTESAGPTLSGGLGLPEGAIPTPESLNAPDTEAGIQMPDQAKPVSPNPGDGASQSKPDILYASWNEIQVAAESSGKVTIVDLWSLSCEPCLKEFPSLVQLHQDLGDSIQCIAVDMDYDGRRTRPPERYADRVGAFLNRVGADGFPTYISNTPSDDVFAAMKIASLPAVLVYKADGSIAKMFVDAGETAGFSYEKDIVPLVTDLVGN